MFKLSWCKLNLLHCLPELYQLTPVKSEGAETPLTGHQEGQGKSRLRKKYFSVLKQPRKGENCRNSLHRALASYHNTHELQHSGSFVPAILNLVWLHIIPPAQVFLTTEQKYFAFFQPSSFPLGA